VQDRDPLPDRAADVVGDEAGALEAELVEQADQQVGLGGDGGVAVEGPLGVAVPE
jgi:hypothetical protein